ncbi:LysM domain receptor-like kinase 3, partial [Tanacetum coccineum]
NLTTADWIQRFNNLDPNRIPDTATINVTVNCSCGDKDISKEYGLFSTYPLRAGENLNTVSSAANLSSDLIRSYNPNANFSAGNLVYIPARDEHGNYPPIKSSKGISGAAIGGIVVGVVAFVLLVAGCVYYGFYKKKNGETSGPLLKNAQVQLMQAGSGPNGTSVGGSESSGHPAGASPRLTGITVDKSVEFSYEELSTATDDFSLANKIGQGGFGAVYYAELRGEKAAIKKMDMQASKEFLAELKVLTHVHHLNLVRLIGYCVEGSLFLVYEFIENGNLSQHLHGSAKDPLPWSTRVQIALDSARGLEYIHEHTVPVYIHRDIKSANILIDKNLCRYAQYGDVSPKVDVYAFGVVLYELISAKEAIVKANGSVTESKGLVALFDEVLSQPDPKDDLIKIIDPRMGDNYPLDSVRKMAQLAKACTHENPQLRPSMRSIVVALMTLSSSTEDWDVGSFYDNQTLVVFRCALVLGVVQGILTVGVYSISIDSESILLSDSCCYVVVAFLFVYWLDLKLSDYPLFLHANDSNGNPMISFKLEGTRNYKVWSAAIKHALHTKNKLGFITGKCERPTDDDVLRQEQWDRCNSVVLSWILGCVTQELYIGQIYSSNAKDVWDELEETYSKTDGSVIYNMHFKVHTFTQSGLSLAEYYHKFNSQWIQYDALVDLPKCTCDTAKKLKKHDQLIRLRQFLMGLDDVYANVRNSILITEPLPDVKSAFAILSRDESHRSNNVYSVNKTGSSSSSAFVSRSNNDWSANKSSNQSSQNRRFNRGPNPNLGCKHYNMIGHTIDRCFELVGYPSGFKKNPKGNNSKASVNNVTASANTYVLSSDNYQKLMALLRNSGSRTACDIGNVTGIPIGSNMVFCFASCRFFNMHNDISTYSAYVGWIIDSGASQHMTYSAVLLFNVIDVSHLDITVAHPNGTVAKVNQIGSFKLTK